MSKEKEKSSTSFVKRFNIFPMLIVLSVCILGVGYGVSNVSFEIGGTAEADAQEGIVITDATQSSATNASGEIGYYLYNILKSTVTLSSSDSSSSITYEITIENTYDVDYWFDCVNVADGNTYYTNDEIEYTLSGLEEGDKLEAGGTITFYLAFSYADGTIPSTSNSTLTSYLQFVFTDEEPIQYALASQSYVGYYADVNADEMVDGIIFVDLMCEQTAEYWSPGSTSSTYISRGTYSWDTISTAQEYTVSSETYSGAFGDKYIITPVSTTSTENERFYVMALSDFTTSSYTTFCWYFAAISNDMDDYATYTSTAFGEGKNNTDAMITKWNARGYGSQNAASSYLDLWGVIQDEVEDGWFVPSSKEWAAFGGKLNITTNDYSSLGLSDKYWSSSQYSAWHAYYAYFNQGYIDEQSVGLSTYIRLATTF